MILAKLIDGAPVRSNRAQLKAEFPRVSIPADPTADDLAPYGWTVVRETPIPSLAQRESAAESFEHDGSEWVQAWTVIPAGPAPVPYSVPAHNLRRALRNLGMMAAVNSYTSALPIDDPIREALEYAPYFRRDAIGIEVARVAMGWTTAQVDHLFRVADAVVS